MDVILIFIIIACLASAVYYALLIPIAIIAFLIFAPKWIMQEREFKERKAMGRLHPKASDEEKYGKSEKYEDIFTSVAKKEE